MQTLLRVGVRKANNSPVVTRGLVTTVLGPLMSLCHLLPVGRTAIIRKVMWYNNMGNATLIFGTVDNAFPAVFIPLFPQVVALNTLDGSYEEDHLPDVEFVPDRTAGAGGMAGDIYVVATLAGILLRLTVEEFGT